MAVNKNALIRYHVLDKCFANPMKKYFLDDLLQACNQVLFENYGEGIQRRQLFMDILFMESEAGYGIVLEKLKQGKKYYYRYKERNFSITQQPINQAEAEQLKSALTVLSRFKGMPQFEWVNELAPKLEQTFLLEKGNQTIISFDNNQFLKGIENLGDLFHAILYQKSLQIQYQSFKSDIPKEYLFHPYYLKQHNNRWFVLGFYPALQRLTTFALDRIVSFSEADIIYIPNTTYNFEEYFEDIIGVTIQENAEIELIELEFDSQTAPYILSKPLHGSQKTTLQSKDVLIISIEVIPNYELESVLLSFGDHVRVLKPQALKENIKTRLRLAFANYDAD